MNEASLPRPAASPRHDRAIIAIALIGLTLIIVLKSMGRIWWCACGQWYPWTSDAWGSHNSQHVADPYTFSHVLHGVVFYWALWFFRSRLHWLWLLAIAAGIEAGWEILENTPFVINRYREGTAALGYNGDSVINSFSDWLAAILGFLLARKVGLRWSIAIYLVLEIWCAWWIKDNLTLNVVMLIYPIEFIRKWQSGE